MVLVPTPKRSFGAGLSWALKLGLAALLLASAVFILASSQPQSAQQRFREPAVKVTGIASNGTSYTITADGPLTRAQTFQTEGWFHVVIVNGQTDLGRGAAGGVRLQRISESLEILIPVKPGASVTVNPRGNRLDLSVEGGSAAAASRAERAAPQATAPSESPHAAREQAARDAAGERAEREAAKRNERAQQLTSASATAPKKEQTNVAPAANATVTTSSTAPVNDAPRPAAGQGNDAAAALAAEAEARKNSEAQTQASAAAAQLEGGEGGGLSGTLFSPTTLLVLLVVVAVAGVLFVLSRRRGENEAGASRKSVKDSGAVAAAKARGAERVEKQAGAVVTEAAAPAFEQSKGDRRRESVPVERERRNAGRGAEDEATRQQKKMGAEESSANGHGERRAEARAGVPSVVFGSYRIDQEVTQLVRGWPHSIEVLASRAVDDRRAVETSLLKALHAAETDEDGRRRVRTACEDYGLVARQNAMLLLASDAYERTAAARTLAEMKSAQALPFLTEALYDADAVVRTEAVKALGALGLPSSIGAMLDVARRHPDIPATILGPALTACSVETVEAGEGLQEEGVTLARAASAEQFVSEMRGVEPVSVRQLPEWLEDATLQEALDRLGSADVEARIVAAQSLASFQVRRAVEALAAMAVRDEAAAVRAAAVTALGSIDHESVFASVLIAMADDSREVRAAAARDDVAARVRARRRVHARHGDGGQADALRGGARVRQVGAGGAGRRPPDERRQAAGLRGVLGARARGEGRRGRGDTRRRGGAQGHGGEAGGGARARPDGRPRACRATRNDRAARRAAGARARGHRRSGRARGARAAGGLRELKSFAPNGLKWLMTTVRAVLHNASAPFPFPNTSTAMPRTPCPHKNHRLRTLVATTLFAALALASLAGLDTAHAQRGAKSANTAKKSASTKRVFVGRGSDSGAGSRQTIKSDNPLNDYSAYRSGDRFNVVIPNADANAMGKGGAGRGYTDMQVQQRGNDVVLSYKLQPGAKPRVEQKFNRLDVVFETPEGGAQPAASKPAQRPAAPATNDARAADARQNQTANRTAQTPAPSSTTGAPSSRTPTAVTQPANPPQSATRQQQTATASSTPEPQPGTTATTNAPAAAPQSATAAPPEQLQLAQAQRARNVRARDAHERARDDGSARPFVRRDAAAQLAPRTHRRPAGRRPRPLLRRAPLLRDEPHAARTRRSQTRSPSRRRNRQLSKKRNRRR